MKKKKRKKESCNLISLVECEKLAIQKKGSTTVYYSGKCYRTLSQYPVVNSLFHEAILKAYNQLEHNNLMKNQIVTPLFSQETFTYSFPNPLPNINPFSHELLT